MIRLQCLCDGILMLERNQWSGRNTIIAFESTESVLVIMINNLAVLMSVIYVITAIKSSLTSVCKSSDDSNKTRDSTRTLKSMHCMCACGRLVCQVVNV